MTARCLSEAAFRHPARGLLALLFLLGTPMAEGAEDKNLEPVPPAVFFRTPDEPAAAEIRLLVSNSFGDYNKTLVARDQLVSRYHVWSIPQLVTEIAGSKNRNESAIWNSLLTLAALRDHLGPAPELHPAIGPINRLMSPAETAEVWRRAFACLAAGCFHWGQGQKKAVVVSDPLYRDDTARMTRELQATVRGLGSSMKAKNSQVAVSALFALAKRGGAEARNVLLSGLVGGPPATQEDRWAALLARGFLRPGAGRPFFAALDTDDSRLRRAAALGLAVAMLSEGAGEGGMRWTADRAPILAALQSVPLNNSDAGPDAVFARGVCAWVNQAFSEWEAIWGIAIGPHTNTETAIAAVQALLFCEQGWFQSDLLSFAHPRGKSKIPEPVLAGFLLLATQSGTESGLAAAEAWLSSGSKRPRGNAAWDVRFHAAVGLLRALSTSALDPKLRARAVAALEAGLKNVHVKAPFRVALASFLEAHKQRILEDDFYRVPDADVLAVEASFTCPYALLSRDLVDVCVHRVNHHVQFCYHLENIQRSKQGSPNTGDTARQFLKAYFEAYPYFSRIEFREARGLRPAPRLAVGDVGLDR